MEKFSKDFKPTAEYYQMWTKIRHLVDVASGHLPVAGAVRIAPRLYVEIKPTFDYWDTGRRPNVSKRKQTGWQLIFINMNENNIFCFTGVSDYPYYTWIRKKDGKAKAAEKFTNAIFLYTFENEGACV